MDPESVSKAIKNAKDALIVLLMVAATVTAFLNKDALVDLLFDLSGRMRTAEVGSVKLSFGEPEAFTLNASLANVPPQDRLIIRESLQKLSGPEVERLLHRAEYDEAHLDPEDMHCDYENADQVMQLYRWADSALIEKRLFKRISKPAFTETQRQRLTPNTLAKLGAPSDCYQIVLTALGANVKSVLVTE
ncbi:MAG TPA: hypothetical protein VED87_10205, partial [Methylocystis sp.]|nr:hypothetical protein [Methylocystis sp.]